jgi:NADPH-dependent 2,4-dienoyl-CoA reductase/sulfur reductase-like enzyme/nitrite reductase/ring-hydroxylating ferredoxin subunit
MGDWNLFPDDASISCVASNWLLKWDPGEKPMGLAQTSPPGPDLTQGISVNDLVSGQMLLGHVAQDPVLLARSGDEFFAIGATCSHYGGPLAEGLIVGDTVRCPWHHARFSLRTGEAVGAPAFNPMSCWRVEKRGDKLFVRQKIETADLPKRREVQTLGLKTERIVIVGGGAAGFAAAEMLRREGFAGNVTLLSADDDAPYDRPNCSKDYLAGNAPEDWMPLRPSDFYEQQSIDLLIGAEVTAIDVKARQVTLASGRNIPFDKLLLATGAEPVRLDIPGADQPHVHVLRSLSDSRTIIAETKAARHAVVIGASFIGLEVAAALRAREIEVHVVAPGHRPLERVLGREYGDFIREIHEEHGVVFHLEETATTIEGGNVKLKGGATLPAEIVVVGVGVRPRLQLAEGAGLKIDRGVVVNEYLETSVPQIFAAGDIARWPDPHTGEDLRIEHWVVAERQGQTVARNMLGQRRRFTDVPFFWSQHYDVPINYVGHAEKWDELEVEGDIKSRDCLVRYRRNGRVLAVASIFRDVDNLKEEASIEHTGLRSDSGKAVASRAEDYLA